MSFFFKSLEFAWFYKLSQILLAPGSTYFLNRKLSRLYNSSNFIVLEVGCGPKQIFTPQTAHRILLDINKGYVTKNIKTDTQIDKKNSQITGIVGDALKLPFANQSFDLVYTLATFHHFPDSDVKLFIKEMIRTTKSQGTILIFDGVYPKPLMFNMFAFFIRKFDRGRFMRTEKQLISIIREEISEPIYYERFFYSLTGLEGVTILISKQN